MYKFELCRLSIGGPRELEFPTFNSRESYSYGRLHIPQSLFESRLGRSPPWLYLISKLHFILPFLSFGSVCHARHTYIYQTESEVSSVLPCTLPCPIARESERCRDCSIHGLSSSSASGSATGLFWSALPPPALLLPSSPLVSPKRTLRTLPTCRGAIGEPLND